MKIEIDGREIEFLKDDLNIVDIAKRAGIHIPAPCYNAGRSGGCCRVCVIEIEGIQKYACCTKPEEGMEIALMRDDLERVREKRIQEYGQNKHEACECDCSSNSECG